MHPKVARALRAARRPYADGGDVVRERATILPLGTYGDGTTRAAWPGVIYEPAAAAKRLVDYFMGGNYRPGDEDATRQLAEDSFTAASAVPVAGLAAAAVRPGTSLGSGGGKLTKSLPMDEASRMARAREMGFDLPAYHATSAEFTEFKPGYRGASFFADNADAAERGATYGAMDKYGTAAPIDRVMPVMLRSKHIAGLNLTPKERAWWDSLPERADERAIESLKMPSRNIDYWWRVYDEVQNPDGTFTYVKKPIPSTTIDEVRKTGRNVYGDKYLGSYDGEQYMAKSARENGMDGFILSDEAGVGIGIADPRRIRSKFAAFDPDQIDSANILAANSSKAASPGLAALESNRVRAYHGAHSPYEGDKYNPRKSQYRAFFAAESPELANNFARYGDNARVYPVDISPDAKMWSASNPKDVQRLQKAIDDGAVGWESLVGSTSKKDWAAKGDGGLMELKSVQQWLKKSGYDGWSFEDVAAPSGIENRRAFGMIRPGFVRNANTGDLLYSNRAPIPLPTDSERE